MLRVIHGQGATRASAVQPVAAGREEEASHVTLVVPGGGGGGGGGEGQWVEQAHEMVLQLRTDMEKYEYSTLH